MLILDGSLILLRMQCRQHICVPRIDHVHKARETNDYQQYLLKALQQVSRPYLNPPLDTFLTFAALNSPHEVFRLKIRPDRVLREALALHEVTRLLNGVEVVDLSLQAIAVWVAVVDAHRRPVVHAPVRQHAFGLALLVCQDEVAERGEGESDVLQAGRSGNLWAGAWDGDDGDAVVLFVVAQEGKFLIHKGDFGA